MWFSIHSMMVGVDSVPHLRFDVAAVPCRYNGFTMVASNESEQRRELHFDDLSEILVEAETAVAESYRPIGNWSRGQIFSHLAVTMEYCLDGFPFKLFPPLRWFMRTFLKKRLLYQGMPTGVKLTGDAARYLKPQPCSDKEGLDRLRTAIHRLETETQREPSPLLGQLTTEQWNQLHLRHAELHLGYLIPGEHDVADTSGPATS